MMEGKKKLVRFIERGVWSSRATSSKEADQMI